MVREAQYPQGRSFNLNLLFVFYVSMDWGVSQRPPPPPEEKAQLKSFLFANLMLVSHLLVYFGDRYSWIRAKCCLLICVFTEDHFLCMIRGVWPSSWGCWGGRITWAQELGGTYKKPRAPPFPFSLSFSLVSLGSGKIICFSDGSGWEKGGSDQLKSKAVFFKGTSPSGEVRTNFGLGHDFCT